MRIVKHRLLEMIPALQVFLDVDGKRCYPSLLCPHALTSAFTIVCADLEEIDKLELYVERTSTVIVYCSDGYFRSCNCMRELIASTVKQKPVIALVDPEATKGGLSLDQVHAQLMNAEPEHFPRWNFDAEETPRAQALYDHLFMSDPIDWNRTQSHASELWAAQTPATG